MPIPRASSARPPANKLCRKTRKKNSIRESKGLLRDSYIEFYWNQLLLFKIIIVATPMTSRASNIPSPIITGTRLSEPPWLGRGNRDVKLRSGVSEDEGRGVGIAVGLGVGGRPSKGILT